MAVAGERGVHLCLGTIFCVFHRQISPNWGISSFKIDGVFQRSDHLPLERKTWISSDPFPNRKKEVWRVSRNFPNYRKGLFQLSTFKVLQEKGGRLEMRMLVSKENPGENRLTFQSFQSVFSQSSNDSPKNSRNVSRFNDAKFSQISMAQNRIRSCLLYWSWRLIFVLFFHINQSNPTTNPWYFQQTLPKSFRFIPQLPENLTILMNPSPYRWASI